MPEEPLAPIGIEPPINPAIVQFAEKTTSTARLMYQDLVVAGDIIQLLKNNVVVREITIPQGKSGRVAIQGGAVVQ